LSQLKFPDEGEFLIWDKPLVEATILKRYKRFLADVSIEGKVLTAHVPNTGSMVSCWEPEWKCALSISDNPNRKMSHTLELIHNGESWIGVNTANANKLAKLWLTQDLLPELKGYTKVNPEKKIGDSRVDFFLEGHPTHPDCYVEVKSVTLRVNDHAQFPDAVSERGQKHLRELMQIKKSGLRAVMLFIVQREDVKSFSPASNIDPVYAGLLKEAHLCGVEILVYGCSFETQSIGLKGPLTWELN
jgi:sugar fermentation stimulation protein A